MAGERRRMFQVRPNDVTVPAPDPADADAALDMAALKAPPVVPAPADGAPVVLVPGEPAVVRASFPNHQGHSIVVTEGEVVLVNKLRRYRCARPGMTPSGSHPPIAGLVSVFVHRRAIGPLDKGHRFVYAVGSADELLGTIDVSDTWAFRQDQIEALCRLVGIGYRVEVYETVGQLVAARPEWAALASSSS